MTRAGRRLTGRRAATTEPQPTELQPTEPQPTEPQPTEPPLIEAEPVSAEARILARVRDDAEAFGELYDLYVDRIHAYVQRRVFDRAAAEDVTTEVFIKAMRAIDGFDPDGPPFAAWLYRIAANTVIDHLRAHRPTVSLEEIQDRVDPAPSTEDAAIARVEADRVWQTVDALTAAQQLAVRLRFGDDLPLAAIAERMGRSEGAVKLLLHRALETIRVRLQVPDQP